MTTKTINFNHQLTLDYQQSHINRGNFKISFLKNKRKKKLCQHAKEEEKTE